MSIQWNIMQPQNEQTTDIYNVDKFQTHWAEVRHRGVHILWLHMTFWKRPNCSQKAGQWLPEPAVESTGTLGGDGNVCVLAVLEVLVLHLLNHFELQSWTMYCFGQQATSLTLRTCREFWIFIKNYLSQNYMSKYNAVHLKLIYLMSTVIEK